MLVLDEYLLKFKPVYQYLKFEGKQNYLIIYHISYLFYHLSLYIPSVQEYINYNPYIFNTSNTKCPDNSRRRKKHQQEIHQIMFVKSSNKNTEPSLFKVVYIVLIFINTLAEIHASPFRNHLDGTHRPSHEALGTSELKNSIYNQYRGIEDDDTISNGLIGNYPRSNVRSIVILQEY